MHQSFVTMAYQPRGGGRGGGSHGNVLCFYFCIVPALRGKNYQGIVLGKNGSAVQNITDCWGKRLLFYLMAVPPSVGLLAGIVKVSAIPQGWLQMTCALFVSKASG